MALVLSVFFGAIGGAFFIYGKRRVSAPYLVAGVLLSVYPWFVDSAWMVALIGVVLVAAPILIQRAIDNGTF